MTRHATCRPGARALPVLLLAAALGLAACAPERPLAPVRVEPGAYTSFLVPAPLLPLEARGAAAFAYKGERESGEMRLTGTAGGAFRLELLARMTGGLVLELRFDRQHLLALDYVNETYTLAANTPAHRQRLFRVDLSPEEFAMLLTARVPLEAFRAGEGYRDADSATFQAGNTRYAFTLGPDGLPTAWRKVEGGRTVLRVEYPAYMAAQGFAEGAPPVRVPQKVRVHLGEDGDAPPVLVLGLSRFVPAAAEAPEALSVTRLPSSAQDFAPVPLPPEPS